MKNPHVAIFTIPAPVHVNPTLSIVSVLVRRGFRVTYVTSQRHADEVLGLGAEVLRCPRFEFPLNQNHGDISTPIDQQYSTSLTDLAGRSLELVAPFYEREAPDLVIFDTHSYAGLLLAERLKIPSVRVTSHLIADEEACFNNEEIDAFFRQYGVDRRNPILKRTGLTVYLFARDMQIGHDPRSTAHFYAARCSAERPCRISRSSMPVRNRDTVLISCSTFYVQGSDYYSMCMEALNQLGRRGMLAMAAQMDVTSFNPLLPNFSIAQGIPLPVLMPHANLLIFQGGMATTMEAIYHGLPMILLTRGHSQLEMYADNVEKRGLGIHLKQADTSTDNIIRSIVQLSSDHAVRDSVRGMQKLVKESPGAEEVVNKIEDVIGY